MPIVEYGLMVGFGRVPTIRNPQNFPSQNQPDPVGAGLAVSIQINQIASQQNLPKPKDQPISNPKINPKNPNTDR
jgi:hypothetical protein